MHEDEIHMDSVFETWYGYRNDEFEKPKTIKEVIEEHMKGDAKMARSRNEYIIGSEDKRTGEFSIARNPKKHYDEPSAKAEAERLASIEPSKKFVVLQIRGKASTSSIVWE